MKSLDIFDRTIAELEVSRNGNPQFEQAIILVNAARDAVAAASTPAEIVDIRDRLAAVEGYLKRRRVAVIEANHVVAERLRLERMIVNLIDGDPDIHQGGDTSARSHRATLLSRYGVNKHQVARWRQYALLDDQEFDAWVADNMERSELSGAWLVKLVSEYRGDVDEPPAPVGWREYVADAYRLLDQAAKAPDADEDTVITIEIAASALMDLMDREVENCQRLN